MEDRIFFNSQDENIKLEGLLSIRDDAPGMVVTHPHPLYGGEMHNPVVEAIVNAFRKKGFTTLRFNFRGVGGSQGEYDDGRGEQRDILGALAYLRKLGAQHLHLAGYSFGAYVCFRLMPAEPDVKRLIMVSPPVGFMAFPPDVAAPCLRWVVTGSEDREIAPVHLIRQQMPGWNPEASLKIIQGADHFYTGALAALESFLIECDPQTET